MVRARIQKLEYMVETLTSRLDSALGARELPRARDQPFPNHGRSASADQDVPPVFLIRNAAAEAGVHSPDHAEPLVRQHADVITSGLVNLSTARSLFSMFVLVLKGTAPSTNACKDFRSIMAGG